jgi:putative ABC transport system ATP-binding protein
MNALSTILNRKRAKSGNTADSAANTASTTGNIGSAGYTANAQAPSTLKQAVPVVDIVRVSKVYGHGEMAVHALRDVSLLVERGDYVAIMGASGSGKSTLMNIIGCLDTMTSGTYKLDGLDVSDLDDDALSYVRSRRIGFVFQAFNLIPRTTALANVELPLVYAEVPKGQRRDRARGALESVGLADRLDHTPAELSGGQQQRVAIARAIATRPAMILADEPTGALDSTSTSEVLDIFERLNSTGTTIVVITHEDEVGERARRRVVFRDGRIIEDRRNDGGLHNLDYRPKSALHLVAQEPLNDREGPNDLALQSESGDEEHGEHSDPSWMDMIGTAS